MRNGPFDRRLSFVRAGKLRSTTRRPEGPSARATYGLRADLIDAYDEHAPIIDVALDPADVVADVVVVAAGRTQPPDGETFERSELAASNA